MRCGDHAGIGVFGGFGSKRSDSSGFKSAQQNDLAFFGEFADLVEKNSPLVATSHDTAKVLVGSRKRAALVADDLCRHQVAWKLRKVEGFCAV